MVLGSFVFRGCPRFSPVCNTLLAEMLAAAKFGVRPFYEQPPFWAVFLSKASDVNQTIVITSASDIWLCNCDCGNSITCNYDGNPHSINAAQLISGPNMTLPSGYEITYSFEKDGTYSAAIPTKTDEGEYTIYVKAEKEDYGSPTSPRAKQRASAKPLPIPSP